SLRVARSLLALLWVLLPQPPCSLARGGPLAPAPLARLASRCSLASCSDAPRFALLARFLLRRASLRVARSLLAPTRLASRCSLASCSDAPLFALLARFLLRRASLRAARSLRALLCRARPHSPSLP